MARNIVSKTYRASGRNLAPYFLQIGVHASVHLKKIKTFNNVPSLAICRSGLQQQNKAARQRCRADLLHQLERLAHAHEALVC